MTCTKINCPMQYDKVSDDCDIKTCIYRTERKKDNWITVLSENGWADHICPVCGWSKCTDVHVSLKYNYCPKCEADMRGEQ